MATASTNLSQYDKNAIPSAKNFRFGIVVSEWNESITSSLLEGAKSALLDCGTSEENIEIIYVPGSFELVYGSKLLQQKNIDAVIAIGSVIRGETEHFTFVCEAVSQGIKDLNVINDIPVIFCVLTDDTFQQAKDRSGGIHGNKGTEAAIAAIKMAAIKNSY